MSDANREAAFALALHKLALICYESNVAPWMDPDAVAFRNAKNDLIVMYRAASADADQRDGTLLLERMVKAYSPAMGRDGVALEIERAEALNAACAYLVLHREPK